MRILTPCLIILGTFGWPSIGLADIGFNNDGFWNTSFDYGSECSMNGNDPTNSIDCNNVNTDSINWAGANRSQGSHYSEAVIAADNVNGDRGMGARFWVNDGSGQNSGEARISFPQQEKEIWLRWYQRYESGFAWAAGNPHYDKCFYIWSSGPGKNSGFGLIAEHQAGSFQVWTNVDQPLIPSSPSVTWQDVFGITSDGLFHMFELHIKVNTAANVADGIVQYWIDGVKYIDDSAVDFTTGSNNKAEALAGIGRMDFHSNQDNVANGGPAYVDYDDIEIWNTTPPNISPDGDPWIGPLNDFSGAGSIPRPDPPASVGVSFNDSIEDNNFTIPGSYDKMSMVLAKLGATSGSTKTVEYLFNSGATQAVR